MLLLCRELFTHCFDLRFKNFNSFILLNKQCLARFNYPNMFLCERDSRRRNLTLIKFALLIIASVAIVNPINKVKKHPKREKGILSSDFHFGVNRKIPQLVNLTKITPHAWIDAFFESIFINQRCQIIPIRHNYGAIRCVNPLYRQFERFSAAHRTHCRRSSKNLFCFYCSISEKIIIAIFAFQEIEIHSWSPSSDSKGSTRWTSSNEARYLSKSLWYKVSCLIRYFSNSLKANDRATSAVTFPGLSKIS